MKKLFWIIGVLLIGGTLIAIESYNLDYISQVGQDWELWFIQAMLVINIIGVLFIALSDLRRK